jgi:hypothetical protein
LWIVIGAAAHQVAELAAQAVADRPDSTIALGDAFQIAGRILHDRDDRAGRRAIRNGEVGAHHAIAQRHLDVLRPHAAKNRQD